MFILVKKKTKFFADKFYKYLTISSKSWYVTSVFGKRYQGLNAHGT